MKMIVAILFFATLLSSLGHTEQQSCVLYIYLLDQQLHVRIPTCFDPKGNVVIPSDEKIMSITGRKGDACHPTIEEVDRIDPSAYLVRTLCPGFKPKATSLIFQLIDDGDGGVLRITNAEGS
jgi:hypothetical protein